MTTLHEPDDESGVHQKTYFHVDISDHVTVFTDVMLRGSSLPQAGV